MAHSKEARRKKLTKTVVEGEKPDPGGSFVCWDTAVTGFGLRVYPSGVKSYVLRYGTGRRGRLRQVTIGEHGAEWSADPLTAEPRRLWIDLARAEALRLKGEVIVGKDPAVAREQARAMPTVREFSVRYLEDHSGPHKTEESAAKDASNLSRLILPRIGSRRMDQVGAEDVTRLHLGLRKTPVAANRVLALLSHMFTMARTWRVLPAGYPNPCEDIPRFDEKKRKRYLSADELRRVGELLAIAERAYAEGRRNSMPALDVVRSNGRRFQSADTFVLDVYAAGAIRLLLFTGVRLSEILRLEWEAHVHVDSDGVMFRQIRTKNVLNDVPLSPEAVFVLASLKRRGRNRYVFPSSRIPGGHITRSGLNQAWGRFRRRVGLRDVRVHDLRHSFASVAVSGGATLPIIGALLGQTRPETTARYAHLFNDPLRLATNAVGKTIDAAMKRGRAR